MLKTFKKMMTRISSIKLRNKLMLSYLIVLIIPILIISMTIYKISSNTLEETAQRFSSMYTSQAVTTIDHFVDGYDQITKSVLVDPEIIHFLGSMEQLSMEEIIQSQESVQRFLMRLITMKPEIKTAMLVSKNNEVYQYSRTNTKVDQVKLLDQTWLMNLRGSKENLFITTAHNRIYSNDREETVFTVGRLLMNYEGSYVGMILLDLDPADLINLDEHFIHSGEQYGLKMMITNRQGELVYHSDVIAGRHSWEEIMDQRKSKKRTVQDDVIVITNKSKNDSLTLRTEVSLGKLLSSNKYMKDVTLVAIVCCLLFTLIISIWFSYSITNPIRKLKKSMKQVVDGEYIPIQHSSIGQDEMNGLISSYNHMILRIKELIEHVFIAEIKQKQAKFLALQTQINPHMLYNTLESIRMRALVKGQEDIADMIKILARMFKLALHKDVDEHLVRHEVEYAMTYLRLQNIRYDDRFTMDVNLSEKVLNLRMIPLVLQPLLENSITHGYRSHESRLHIWINEMNAVNDSDVKIRVMDSGQELTPEKAEEINRQLRAIHLDRNREIGEDFGEKGIGLVNIAERIKLHYGNQYDLSIHVLQGIGTAVELVIPRN